MDIDIEYILKNLSDRYGTPVRIYEGGKMTFFYSLIDLRMDPFETEAEKLDTQTEDIRVIQTQEDLFYTYVVAEEKAVIFGPMQKKKTPNSVWKLLSLKLGIPIRDIGLFLNQVNLLSVFDYKETYPSLKNIYHILTGKKLQLRIPSEEKETRSERRTMAHNSYSIEKEILNIVKEGDLEALSGFIRNLPYFESGTLSQESLRQTKNLFIVSITLISRTAISQGMDIEEALSLSDSFISLAENAKDEKEISHYSYQAVKKYTEKVNEIKSLTPLVYKVKKYVEAHFDEKITLESLEVHLNLPKTTLVRKFKKEANESIHSFIEKTKIEKSKEMMKEGYSLSQIAYYLGYSSQSHFTNVFLKREGLTPNQYSKRNISKDK